MMKIEDILNGIYPLPEASLMRLEKCVSLIKVEKGLSILRTGKVERNIYFISKGIVRAYFCAEDKDVTFWIGMEGNVVLSVRSFFANEPGYETVEVMEDSELFQIDHTDLLKCFDEDIHIANWGRRFAEKEFMATEKRLIPMLFMSASERYNKLLEDNPKLLQRLPLEKIASYLGITPVSLSRIRASIRNPK